MASTAPAVFGFIIDDDPDARFLLDAQIRETRLLHHIEIANCGADAIGYFKGCLAGENAWPCIVFLDINMPGMDGFEVLAWCQLNGITGKTVLVMCSSCTDPDAVKRAFNLGAQAFLAKHDPQLIVPELVRTAVSFMPWNEKIAALAKFRPGRRV